MLLFVAVTWLFLDETLIKKKTNVIDEDEEGDLPEDSSDPLISNDSSIELIQPVSNGNPECEFSERTLHSEEDSRKYEFEIDECETDTDSNYDISSDTELIQTPGIKKHFNLHRYLDECKKLLHKFSVRNLFLIVTQRITDCIGGFVSCAVCLRKLDYNKCKPRNFKEQTSGCGHALVYGVLRTVKLFLDRKVFVSVFLYGILAFLSTTTTEVRML